MLKRFSMLVLPLSTVLTLSVLMGNPMKVNAQNLSYKANKVVMNKAYSNEADLPSTPVINGGEYVTPQQIGGTFYGFSNTECGVVDSNKVSTRLIVNSKPWGRRIGSLNPDELICVGGYAKDSHGTVWLYVKYWVDGTNNTKAKIGWVDGDYISMIP